MATINFSKPLTIPKNPSKKFLYTLLEEAYCYFNAPCRISESQLDPLGIARDYQEERVAIFCALFAYGNVRAMIKFLKSCDLAALKKRESQKICTHKPYRFQTQSEIQAFFKTLCEIQNPHTLFLDSYLQSRSILAGIQALQKAFYQHLPQSFRHSKGLIFLIGKPHSTSPLKRWNMLLRWLVRKDKLDMGLWRDISPSDLILPLDTHTFKISQRLGIITRKTYDLKSALEATHFLKSLDPKDPIKYDFALYRMSQLKLL